MSKQNSKSADAKPTPLGRRVSHHVVNLAARGLINVALALPYKRRVPFMGWIVANVIGRIAPYHRRAKAHLALIFPDMPPAERARIATACINNAGRSLIENYSTKDFLAHMEGTPIEGPGFAAMEEATNAGRAIILQTGHFGNYEAVRATILALGYKPGGIYREMTNPFFNKHYIQTLHAYGGPGFP